MTGSKLIVRTTKNVFFKSKTYEIKVSGADDRQINFENIKTEYDLPIGKYTVKIGNQESFSVKEIILSTGQHKTITINPSVSYELSFGLLLGLALMSIVVQYFILGKFSIPLMFIPFIPFLVMRKRQFANSFTLTVM